MSPIMLGLIVFLICLAVILPASIVCYLLIDRATK